MYQCKPHKNLNQKGKLVAFNKQITSTNRNQKADQSSNMKDVGGKDEPVTPAGRLFLQPEMDQVINCAIGVQHPPILQTVRDNLRDSIMANHPRFRSLFVKDKHGRECWRRLDKVDIDKHVFEPAITGVNPDLGDQGFVNAYLADLSVSSPLGADKPLWEIHVLKAQRCFVLRLHHSLGDGVSLMSLFLTCCRKVEHPEELPNTSVAGSTNPKRSIFEIIWRWLMVVVLTLVYVLRFLGRALWVKDEKTVISGGEGVELWPRKLATAKFSLEDMKLVKKALLHGTINDVLFGVISTGFRRYFDLQSPTKTKDGVQITGLAMVNIRKQPGLQDLSKLMENKSSSRWGNQFGFVLLPIYLHEDGDDPLESVARAKTMLDRKKLSLEAYFSYRIGKLVMSYLGAKFAALLNYRIVCNTTFTLSNVVGPQEEIMFAGNPLTYIKVNSTALSHAITMHMVTYNGTAYMQILAAKDIIPDPRVLAKCFEDALILMKDAAMATKTPGGTVSGGATDINKK